jgi:hypothetical protein
MIALIKMLHPFPMPTLPQSLTDSPASPASLPFATRYPTFGNTKALVHFLAKPTPSHPLVFPFPHPYTVDPSRTPGSAGGGPQHAPLIHRRYVILLGHLCSPSRYGDLASATSCDPDWAIWLFFARLADFSPSLLS